MPSLYQTKEPDNRSSYLQVSKTCHFPGSVSQFFISGTITAKIILCSSFFKSQRRNLLWKSHFLRSQIAAAVETIDMAFKCNLLNSILSRMETKDVQLNLGCKSFHNRASRTLQGIPEEFLYLANYFEEKLLQNTSKVS